MSFNTSQERLQTISSDREAIANRDLHFALSQLGETIQADLRNVYQKLERLSETVSGTQAPTAHPARRRARRQRVFASAPRAFESMFSGRNQSLGLAWTGFDFSVALFFGIATTFSFGFHSAFGPEILFAFLTALATAGLSRLFKLHDLHPNRAWIHERALILLTASLSALGINGVVQLHGLSESHSTFLILNIGLTFTTMSLGRTLWHRRTAAHFKRGIVTRNFIIAGADSTGREVRDYLTSLAYLGYRFRGFVKLDEATADLKIPVEQLLGRVKDVIPLSKSLFVDEIIFTRRPETAVLISTLDEARASGVDVRLIPNVSETLQNRSDVHYVGDLPTIVLHQRKTRATSLLVKRVLDVAAASTGIILTSPVWIVVALAIKFGSPGPLFYTSNRVGFKGRIFPCYKFRTMVSNAEKLRFDLEHLNEREGILFKISNDPRITNIGKFLRKYSLDELPQLWNVLRGDMSMVGPRPPISSEVAQYEIEHLRRLEVTPGITGLWQVEARHKPSFENYIELDRAYVSNWSIGLDLKILARTVKVVLLGTGT